MNIRHLVTIAVVFVFFAVSAFAGPPLVCHTFDIGNAKSLPWISHGWNLTGDESYETKNLPADTLSILDNDSTVLVHMETLRRAALYGQKDPQAPKQLLLKLIARSDSAKENSSAAALASFDLGYFTQVLGQIHWINKQFANPAQSLDGYSLVKKALQLRPDDAQMNFAAALITLDNPAADQAGHAKKALVGAQSDPLLARNLSTHFIRPDSETMADMISRNSTVKMAHQ